MGRPCRKRAGGGQRACTRAGPGATMQDAAHTSGVGGASADVLEPGTAGAGEKTSTRALARVLVLVGTAGAGGMIPPTSTRISDRIKRVHEHSSPVKILH